jgi:WD40 repeat protein
MNKELLDKLPADERSVAEHLSSAAEYIKLSESFQWTLEVQLMNAYPSQNKGRSLLMSFMRPVAWALTVLIAVLLAGWMLRTLLPPIQPAALPTPVQEDSFGSKVRQGDICAGPLALEHSFAAFLTNKNKTGFIELDEEKNIGEIRSFMWSQDGSRLAILGNTTGQANIYLTDVQENSLQAAFTNPELDYMMGAAWSRDGKQFVMWSAQNNKVPYLLNADGTGLVEKPLNMQILGTPQFAPDGLSVVFYGADSSSSGLFEMMLVDSQVSLLNSSVAGDSSFAFSPDGSHLAYMEYDRDLGEARLVSEDLTLREITILGTLPMPKGSGSSLPKTANLNWSADGKLVLFDLGRGANDRGIYLAHADGTGMAKVVDSGYAPSISSDGRCLAYISDKKVFLLDMAAVSSNPVPTASLVSVDLPAGRSTPSYQLDKLQWQP